MNKVHHIGVLALVLIFSTAHLQAQEYLREQTKKEIATLRADINRKFWVSNNQYQQQLCASSTYQPDEKCRPLKPGSWFIVKDLAVSGGFPEHDPNIYTWKYFRVQTEDGRTGYVQIISRPAMLTEDPRVTAQKEAERKQAAIADCERRGQPKIGMTASEATATCWGNPVRVVKKTTAAGIQEDFVYSLGHILQFNDGKLNAILETR